MNGDKVILGIAILISGLLGYFNIKGLMGCAVGVGVALILIGSLTK